MQKKTVQPLKLVIVKAKYISKQGKLEIKFYILSMLSENVYTKAPKGFMNMFRRNHNAHFKSVGKKGLESFQQNRLMLEDLDC